MISAQTGPRRTSFADRYRALLEIGRTLTGTFSTDELFRRIYRETSKVLDTTGFYISLYDEAEDLATVVFFADRGEERRANVTYRGSDSEVLRTGRGSSFHEGDDSPALFVLGDDDSEVTRSAVSAPMRYKGSVTGVVSAQSYAARAYSAVDSELLQGIADMAAVAIENARRLEELEARRVEAERIEEIGRAVTSSLDLRKVLDKVIEAALELLSCDAAMVWFLEEDCNVRAEAAGGALASDGDQEWAVGGEGWKTLVKDRRSILIPDLTESPLTPPSWNEQTGCSSAMVVPLVVEDEVVGGLSVASREPGVFSGRARTLERLASQASVALENARLHASVQELSLTDPLTGLPNRRQLEVHLKREFAAARRGRMLAVVIFDLDDFKVYNDTLGHQAGDTILRTFGEILHDESRTMNLTARYGGDEFISVLSDTAMEGVRIHAERVSNSLLDHPTLRNQGVTVSYGMAEYTEEMESSSDLIRAADEALYRAKETRPRPTASGPAEASGQA